jgi:hypothetical protein
MRLAKMIVIYGKVFYVNSLRGKSGMGWDGRGVIIAKHVPCIIGVRSG